MTAPAPAIAAISRTASSADLGATDQINRNGHGWTSRRYHPKLETSRVQLAHPMLLPEPYARRVPAISAERASRPGSPGSLVTDGRWAATERVAQSGARALGLFARVSAVHAEACSSSRDEARPVFRSAGWIGISRCRYDSLPGCAQAAPDSWRGARVRRSALRRHRYWLRRRRRHTHPSTRADREARPAPRAR